MKTKSNKNKILYIFCISFGFIFIISAIIALTIGNSFQVSFGQGYIPPPPISPSQNSIQSQLTQQTPSSTENQQQQNNPINSQPQGLLPLKNNLHEPNSFGKDVVIDKQSLYNTGYITITTLTDNFSSKYMKSVSICVNTQDKSGNIAMATPSCSSPLNEPVEYTVKPGSVVLSIKADPLLVVDKSQCLVNILPQDSKSCNIFFEYSYPTDILQKSKFSDVIKSPESKFSQNPQLCASGVLSETVCNSSSTLKENTLKSAPDTTNTIKPSSNPSSSNIKGPTTIDPGTATVPGSSYSSRDENPKSCVGFYCLYEPTHNTPGAPKFSNDEICRNGIDDNGNGKVDEDPYCTVVSGVSAPPPPPSNDTLTPIPSQGPSPFG